MRLVRILLAIILLVGLVAALSTSVGRAPSAAAASVAHEPYRVLDTRSGAKPAGGSVLTVETGHAGAASVGVNTPITDNDLAGFVTAWSGAGTRPTASVLNTDAPGQTRANYVVVPVQSAWKARGRCIRASPSCRSTPTTSSWPPSTT